MKGPTPTPAGSFIAHLGQELKNFCVYRSQFFRLHNGWRGRGWLLRIVREYRGRAHVFLQRQRGSRRVPIAVGIRLRPLRVLEDSALRGRLPARLPVSAPSQALLSSAEPPREVASAVVGEIVEAQSLGGRLDRAASARKSDRVRGPGLA